ncbi:MAG: universal stress protein [Sandaracinaceae bacterium]|nr:universal stress protein [Myxococcales bacterium]MCB9591094.1 universal stress protein [Sandaracinaceae bacterium]
MDAIRRILVPIDFSELSEVAVRTAAGFARREGARLRLVHAVRLPFFHTTYDINIPPSVWEGMAERARTRLEGTRDELDDAGLPGVELVVSDALQPAELVASEAAKFEADLVVLSTHGRRGLRRAALGSVAEETVRISPVPVLAVKEEPLGPETLRRILVPVDFSTHSDEAVALARFLARRFDASLELLHVFEPSPEYARLLSEEIARFERHAREVGREKLEKLGARLEGEGLRVHTRLGEGRAADTIAEHAGSEQSDLIVMGTHGHRGFDRLALGSVAARTLRRAPCPILTTRSRA